MNRLGTRQRVKVIVKQLNQNKQLITRAHSKSLGHPTTASHAFTLGLQRLTQQQAAAVSHQNIHGQQPGNGAEVHDFSLKIRTVELFLYMDELFFTS